MKIIEITDTMQKQAITRQILEALPEWFGIAEAREEYINALYILNKQEHQQ